MERFLEF